MDCSWLQKPWAISTPVRGPSNLPKLTTTVGTCGAVQALRFRVTKNFQKLNVKLYLPCSGEFSARGSDNGCRNSKFHVKAGSGQPLEFNRHESSSPRSSWESARHGIDVFYRFSRPYALLGRVPVEQCKALRFRVTKNFQKLNAKLYLPCSGEFSARGSDNGCRNSKFHVKVGSGQPLEFNRHESSSPRSSWESARHGIDVFYRFSRPYALLGRFLAILSMSLLAMEKFSDFSPSYFKGLLKALVVAVLMHLYNGGLNQLTDIEIDKVNKPYLPLASGEYSYKTGSLIVAFCAIVSFCIGWTEGSWPLFLALFGDFFIVIVYSVDLPLLRWKRSGFLAAVCMVLSGVFLTVSYYLHFQTHLLQKPAVFSMPLIFTTAFVSFFSMIIALVKDIPDIEGDKAFGVQSYTLRLGQERVFWICVTLLEMAYGAAICVGAMSPNLWSKWAMVVSHTIMAMALWNRAKQTDVKNQDATQAFYMFIWKLLYAEYLLVPFLRY